MTRLGGRTAQSGCPSRHTMLECTCHPHLFEVESASCLPLCSYHLFPFPHLIFWMLVTECSPHSGWGQFGSPKQGLSVFLCDLEMLIKKIVVPLFLVFIQWCVYTCVNSCSYFILWVIISKYWLFNWFQHGHWEPFHFGAFDAFTCPLLFVLETFLTFCINMWFLLLAFSCPSPRSRHFSPRQPQFSDGIAPLLGHSLSHSPKGETWHLVTQ